MMDEGFWCLTGLRRLNHGDVEVLGLGFRVQVCSMGGLNILAWQTGSN